MKKGLGKALEIGISPRFQPEIIPEEDVSLLYSGRRLKIIEYLANRPCASISDISSETGLSQGSVRWHVKQMLENLLLEECAPRRYAAPDTVPYEWTAIFVALHNPVEYAILDALLKKGSMRSQELSRTISMDYHALSYHLRKLVDFGVINVEKRYYSVEFNVVEIQEKSLEITGKFVANLLLKARMQGVLMEMEHRKHEYIIRVRSEDEMSMTVHEVPFHEVLG